MDYVFFPSLFRFENRIEIAISSLEMLRKSNSKIHLNNAQSKMEKNVHECVLFGEIIAWKNL